MQHANLKASIFRKLDAPAVQAVFLASSLWSSKGQLSITAGGMTEGNGTSGQSSVGRMRPQRGRTSSCPAPVRPL